MAEIIGYKLKKDLPGTVLTASGEPRKTKFPVGASVAVGKDDYFDKNPDYWEPIYKESEQYKAGDWIYIVKNDGSWKNRSDFRNATVGKIAIVRYNEAYNNKNSDVEDYVNVNLEQFGSYDIPRAWVRKATEKEIKAKNDVVVLGYTSSYSPGAVEFGCQTFTKDEVATLHRVIASLGGRIFIQGAEISKDEVEKVLRNI
jgi:hypothetical protein